MFTITLDGPSASGKSTVADIVAKKLKINHLNSGEFYRAITLYMLRKKIKTDDFKQINHELPNINIEVKFLGEKQIMILNGEDVSELLHSNEVNATVSNYSHNEEVVKKASELTYLATKSHNLIIDGRNVGSFVLPNAECKIYLDCDAKIRAERRFKEQIEKGAKVTFEEIYKQTLERDELDRTRKIAPLVVPKDAIIITSDAKTPEDLADEIIKIVLSQKS